MPLPIISGHPEDDVVEQYGMNRLAAENLAAIEEHLLVCQSCQIRLAEFDDFITKVRAAGRGSQFKSSWWKSFQLGGRRRNRLRNAENQTLGSPWGRPFGLPGFSPGAVKKPGLLRRPFMKNVFISHGGPSITHVEAVCDLLDALGLTPVVSVDMPNLGLSVQDKIQKYMRICRSAVVLATLDDEAPVPTTRARPNVEHEIGMLQTMPNIGNRIVYMKDPRVQFPSNYREKAWIRFDRDRISESFVPLVRELRAFAS